MVPRQVAQEAPVLVMLHPGKRHVGGGLDVWNIQPQGDMLQCGTLDLHESDRVAQPQRQVGGPPLLSVKDDLVVRVGEDGEHVAALGSDQDGIALNAQHRAAHPVDEILLLLQIPGERDPHALVDGNLQGLAVHELAGVVVVADIALVVARHIPPRAVRLLLAIRLLFANRPLFGGLYACVSMQGKFMIWIFSIDACVSFCRPIFK